MLRRCTLFLQAAVDVSALPSAIAWHGFASYDISAIIKQSSDLGLAVLTSYPSSKHAVLRNEQRAFKKRLVFVESSNEKQVAIFSDGSVVGFGVDETWLKQFRSELKIFEVPKDPMIRGPDDVFVAAKFTTFDGLAKLGYEPPDGVDESYIDDGDIGAIVLRADHHMQKLPFAFCLVELVRLKAVNCMLQPIAGKVADWQKHIKTHGTLPGNCQEARVAKAQVMRMMSHQSKLGSARHRVMWDESHSSSRQVFHAACEHYELQSVDSELKERLAALAESLKYLSEQAHKDTDLKLEYVIIVLIAGEIVLHLLH